jgi:hypothetical protein
VNSLKLLVGLALAPVFAHADDGILYIAGPPELMKSGAKIRMVSEFVLAKVRSTHAKVYCRFVLRNEGGATTARIGFPDGSDHDKEGDDPDDKPLLKKFRSVVDGKPVRLSIQKSGSEDPFAFYHVKNVRFAAHQTLVIEDWYEQPLDEGATDSATYIKSFSYTMVSGASWKGLIHKAEVKVCFTNPILKKPAPVELDNCGEVYGMKNLKRMPKNRVFYSGFSKAAVIPHGVVFRARNLKPVQQSNIQVAFGPMKPYGSE